jgi:DNA-binding NarL/FixJ family response regulator
MEVCGIAGSAEEALDAFDAAAYDLVIADVSLPGMDGIALVGRLRERRPDLPALVISGFEEEMYARRALEAGAYAFLSKRGLDRQLPAVIREAIGGDGQSSPPPSPSGALYGGSDPAP